MPAQGSTPQHIAPGYEHLFCQCGCGAPVEAAGAVHAAAAAQRQLEQQQQPGGHSHGVQFGGAGQGMMHAPHPPSMYPPGPYTGQQDMVRGGRQNAMMVSVCVICRHGSFRSYAHACNGGYFPDIFRIFCMNKVDDTYSSHTNISNNSHCSFAPSATPAAANYVRVCFPVASSQQ